MPSISIVTDSAAQFSDALYEGCELVSSLAMQIQIGNEWLRDTPDPRTCHRLAELPPNQMARLHPPKVEDFVHLFSELSPKSDSIICILSSDYLTNNLANARQAAEIVKGPAAIQIIDSLTTGPGLGLIVQSAARAALTEKNGAQLGRLIRGFLPQVYTAYVFPNLRPLALHAKVDIAQAVAAEMLGLLPFYVMEGGVLAPKRKARSARQVVDLLQEFAEEFDQLHHLALIQGLPPHDQDLRNLRDRLRQAFPAVTLTEHMLSASQVALFGAQALGLAAMEKTHSRHYVGE